jgi:hypothetical protein
MIGIEKMEQRKVLEEMAAALLAEQDRAVEAEAMLETVATDLRRARNAGVVFDDNLTRAWQRIIAKYG